MQCPPNILLLVADQHRFDSLGCAGHAGVVTPNLDALAAGGVFFDRCVSSHPVCAPYRASLQTGHFSSRHGVTWNEQQIDRSLPCLGSLFSEHGYHTHYIGKSHWNDPKNWHDSADPNWVPPEFRLGWSHWDGFANGHEEYRLPEYDEKGNPSPRFFGVYGPELQTDWAITTLRESAERDKPCLIQLNWGPPHNFGADQVFQHPSKLLEARTVNDELGLGLPDSTFESPWHFCQSFPQHLLRPVVPGRFLDLYPVDRIDPPPNIHENWRASSTYHLREYYAAISSLDYQVGRLVQALRDSGQWENTVMIYTSDHGDWVGSHHAITARGKCSPHQCNARVPLIMAGGPVTNRGYRPDALVSTLDLLPTLLDLAGIPQTGLGIPGASMAPWLFEDSGPRHESVLLGLPGWRAVYDGRLMYSVGQGGGDGPAKPTHLFDFEADPFDLHNKINDPASSLDQKRLHDLLVGQLKALDTAFLQKLSPVETAL